MLSFQDEGAEAPVEAGAETPETGTENTVEAPVEAPAEDKEPTPA